MSNQFFEPWSYFLTCHPGQDGMKGMVATQDSRNKQKDDSIFFSRESQPKPSFARLLLGWAKDLDSKTYLDLPNYAKMPAFVVGVLLGKKEDPRYMEKHPSFCCFARWNLSLGTPNFVGIEKTARNTKIWLDSPTSRRSTWFLSASVWASEFKWSLSLMGRKTCKPVAYNLLGWLLTSWWLNQPIWKIWDWIISPSRSENK